MEHISVGMNKFLLELYKHWRDIDAPAWNNPVIREDILKWVEEHHFEEEFNRKEE